MEDKSELIFLLPNVHILLLQANTWAELHEEGEMAVVVVVVALVPDPGNVIEIQEMAHTIVIIPEEDPLQGDMILIMTTTPEEALMVPAVTMIDTELLNTPLFLLPNKQDNRVSCSFLFEDKILSI